MTARPDRRRWPANDHVAARRLEGRVEGVRLVDPTPMSVTVPLADLLTAPDGRRDRQAIFGDVADVLDIRDGMAFVELRRDGFTGYLPAEVLAEAPAPTHRVAVAQSTLYPKPDLKTQELAWLTMGAALHVTGEAGRFAETSAGFVPAQHLVPLDHTEPHVVAVAERLIGTPYLWGGNSRLGIDCSGLVQAACLACGIACPGDSDMQERELGAALPGDARLQRGDLLFWKGHVAFVSDEKTILHANAGSMSVAFEGLADALSRIERAGDGKVTARKRL